MESVKDALLNRTSVRRYEREIIPEETMQFIFDAIRNTPTSYNGQQFSVIDIDDQALKEELYALTNQKQLKTCNLFLSSALTTTKSLDLQKRKVLTFLLSQTQWMEQSSALLTLPSP